MNIRPMSESDLPAVFAVRTATIENAITMEELASDYGVTPESLAKALQGEVKGWVCEVAGRLVGFSMGNGSRGEVLVLAVLPAFERKGIGGALLDRVVEWLFSLGHESVWLCANPDPGIRAYGFYRSRGWRTTGEMKGADEIMVLKGNRTVS